jgi:hypothetical protein
VGAGAVVEVRTCCSSVVVVVVAAAEAAEEEGGEGVALGGDEADHKSGLWLVTVCTEDV